MNQLAELGTFEEKSERKTIFKNVMSVAKSRQKQAKKRSLHGANEHKEPVFNEEASAIVFQQPAKEPLIHAGRRLWRFLLFRFEALMNRADYYEDCQQRS